MPDEIANAVLASETIFETFERLEAAQRDEMQRLETLEAKRKHTRLSKDEYLSMIMLQDSVALRVIELTEAEAQRRFEEADVLITEASIVHDRGVGLTRDAAQEVVGLLVALHQAIARFEAVYQAQHARLDALVHADGTPLFLDMQTPRSAAERLIAGLPQGSHLLLYLFEPTSHAPTVREFTQALDAIAGGKPLSPRLITRFLEGYHPHGRNR